MVVADEPVHAHQLMNATPCNKQEGETAHLWHWSVILIYHSVLLTRARNCTLHPLLYRSFRLCREGLKFKLVLLVF